MKQVCVAWLLLLCVSGAAGALDDDCVNTAACNNDAQVCDGDKCKLKADADCVVGGTGDDCVSDSTCGGTAGTSDSATCACDANYINEGDFCKLKADQDCTAGAGGTGEKCVSDSTCGGTAGTTGGATCACDANYVNEGGLCNLGADQDCTAGEGETGEKCVSDSTCGAGATCACDDNYYKEGSLCKLGATQNCVPATTGLKCVADSTCSGGTGTETCTCATNYANDGGRCKLDFGSDCSGDNSGNCKTGSVCDSANQCKLDVDGVCTSPNAGNCKAGTTCDNGVCKLKAGEMCVVLSDKCATDRVCEADFGNACRIKATKACTGDETDKCTAGATCSSDVCTCNTDISTETNGACVPKQGLVGGTCKTGDTCDDTNAECSGGNCQCKTGFITDPITFGCAIAPGQSCSSNTGLCVSGTTCEDGTTCKLLEGVVCTGTGAAANCVKNSDCTDRKCTCSDTYSRTSSGTCGKSDGATGPVLSVLLLMATLMITCFA